MTKIEESVECGECGYVIDTTKDEENKKYPCEKCGSTKRNYTAGLFEGLQVIDGYEIKGKRPGRKKPFIEEMSRPDYSHNREKLVHKERLIDRDNDKYFERVTDYQTKEVIRECEELLSDHFGHGTAKFKKDV